MRFIVVTAHRQNAPIAIRCRCGDRVRLGQRDDDYPGWVRVTTPANEEGWAPEAIIDVEAPDRGTVTQDYDARELTTAVGETVTCLRQLAGWAWVENAGGETGWVPVASIARL
jgi:hypothetical protein